MKLLTKTKTALCAVTIVILTSATGSAAITPYFNGFETDIAGWDAFGGAFNPTRVASGTDGISSASGAWHAKNSATGSAGNWGGYNYGAGNNVPTAFQEYTTSLDIFLNVGGGWSNDTRFDFTSAINNSLGTHLRDFAFNAGFYNDANGPGANTNRFVISTGNNTGRSNSFPKNTGAIAISTTGWYKFQNHFYDDGGVLNVDLSIFDASNSPVSSWTLGNDPITGVGGNRYGWFANNEFPVLAFDNTSLTGAAVPEPASLIVWSLLSLAAGGAGWWRHRRTTAR